ncbi:ethanolamine utilization protein EutA [Stenotrophomonas maltophilia]|nr:ethanolamine utilization protein EutA [Stenotrophomonas maltophilia]
MPECAKVGIGRSKAYELANAGLLETVSIGRRRFVYLDSLYTLPARLAREVREAVQ